MDFKRIIQPVEKELKEFSGFYKSRLKTKVSLLTQIVNYGTQTEGKKLRPALVFLTSLMCAGKVTDRAMNGAVLTEMLHNATLVHDDVVDDADERRGIKSINALWNNQIAVLVGDYFLAQGLLTAIDNDEFEYLRILSNSVKRMSEGELSAIDAIKNGAKDEETYFNIISSKTASLLASCTEIGAVSADANAEEREAASKFGEYIGIAFQIKDDIFDYTSNHAIIGKPTGNDIREKKITLPLIYSLSHTDSASEKKIMKMLKNKEVAKKDIAYIIDFVIQSGGIEYAQKKAEEYSETAKNVLKLCPESEAKSSLLMLADFVHQRTK
jgi:octaprenyl-diphosphate synthase